MWQLLTALWHCVSRSSFFFFFFNFVFSQPEVTNCLHFPYTLNGFIPDVYSIIITNNAMSIYLLCGVPVMYQMTGLPAFIYICYDHTQ